MPEIIELSAAHARKLALASQGMHLERKLGQGKNATCKAIEKLGYIQIDTISVVERAHHHTLWSRVKNYRQCHLDQLQQDGKIFEYWSHAAAYLPMRDYRYSLPRKRAIRNGEQHWYQIEPKLAREVLARITDQGPLQSKDFVHLRKGQAGWWDWKPAKQALENLFMSGQLMVAKRQGFQKVYDLTERVLPAGVDQSMPSQKEFLVHLIQGYLRANGLGTPSQIAYLRKGIKSLVQTLCAQLVEAGELRLIQVAQQKFYAMPNFEQLLAQPLSRKNIKVLSPFDNVLIQRHRIKQLFGFEYQIECYLPATKRRFGYFVLPILWGHEFAGRMDAKIDRKSGLFTINKLFIETKQAAEFSEALRPALENFCEFNGGQQIKIASVITV